MNYWPFWLESVLDTTSFFRWGHLVHGECLINFNQWTLCSSLGRDFERTSKERRKNVVLWLTHHKSLRCTCQICHFKEAKGRHDGRRKYKQFPSVCYRMSSLREFTFVALPTASIQTVGNIKAIYTRWSAVKLSLRTINSTLSVPH
jgi:hypothetical protein